MIQLNITPKCIENQATCLPYAVQVVNATGAWAPYLSAMAGVMCPLVPFRHAYIVTEAIEGKTYIHHLLEYLVCLVLISKVLIHDLVISVP